MQIYKLIKRYKKILLKFLAILLLFIVISSVLLAIPTVQTRLGKVATSYLKKEYDVAIDIKKIDLSFLGNVALKEILIKDHHADSLIYVNTLKTSVLSFKNLLNNKLEFGNILLKDFKLIMKTYKGEPTDALSVFIEKFEEETPPETPSNFLLISNKVKLKNGYVEIIDENIEEPPTWFKNINGIANNFKIEGSNVSANLHDISFTENNNLQITSLTSNFIYTPSYMEFLNTNLATAHSKIKADVKFTYTIEDLSDFTNKVKVNAEIKKASLSSKDLRKLYAEFGVNNKLYLTSKIQGTLNKLNLNNLKLTTNKKDVVSGDVLLENVFSAQEKFLFTGNFKNISSTYQNLKMLLPNVLGKNIPPSFKELGRFNLSGKTEITKTLVDAKLTLNSKLGLLKTNLKMNNINNIDNAFYEGTVNLKDFELGKVLGDSLIGQLSLNGNIKGKGFILENVNTTVKGEITKHQYKGYTYQNIKVNGQFKNKHFNGILKVKDPNIELDFNGLADFSGDINKFNFTSKVKHCNLKNLNLFTRDSISKISGNIDMKMNGNTINDMVGAIQFTNALYTNQKDKYYFKDFSIVSSFKDSIRNVSINSPEIISGNINGVFKFEEIGKLIQNSVGGLFSNYQPLPISLGQQVEFKFKIYNKIIEVFFPEISLSANTQISGEINADEDLFKLNVKSPQIKAYNTIIDKINLLINSKNPLFNTQLKIKDFKSEYYRVSDFQLVNATINDTLFFRTEFKGGELKKERFNLSFYHTINAENKLIVGLQKSDVKINNTKWNIANNNAENNKLEYDRIQNKFTFLPFKANSKDQEIKFSGKIKNKNKDLKFNFKKVNLTSITPKIDSLDLKGELNGSLNYVQVQQKIMPKADLKISDFHINKSHQGDLMLDIQGKNSFTTYDVLASLTRDNSENFMAKGQLDFSKTKPTINLNVEFNEFKLDAFSPLGEDVFSNIRGFAYGSVQVKGELNNPEMEGDLFLDQAGLSFPLLNVDYDMYGTSVIALKKRSFIFEDVNLKDTKHQTTGKLQGTITHHKFEDWKMNLNIATNNLLVLDTPPKEDALYYGTGFISGKAYIQGAIDNLAINVLGKTNKGTHFVIPISDVKTVQQGQLIRYVNKNKKEDEKIRKQFISEKLKGVTLNFILEVTKDATVEMILDKSTGSYLKGKGTGNLQIGIDTNDKFEMFGDFFVDSGEYSFKYGGFLFNKLFTVRSGGNISWSGNPYTADINIEAVYRVSANPRLLLENITSTRKIPINLITRFSGELFNSHREFDLEIPNSSSTVASELEFKLKNSGDNTKALHFASLLASGTFYNEENLSANSAGLAYGTGLDILSNAFDYIFNQADSKLKIKPVYVVGEKNKVDNIDVDDQLGFAVDYQLNDRILINGKVGVPIGSKKQSTVIGELTIDFLLNEEGTLKSSIFNRQNEIQYTEEEEGYTQGVGLSYQIDFDNGKELLQKLGLKKKDIKKDTVEKQTDTLKIKDRLIRYKQNKKTTKNE